MAKLALFKTDAQRKAAARRVLKKYGSGKRDIAARYEVMNTAQQFGWIDDYKGTTNQRAQSAVSFVTEIADLKVKRNPTFKTGKPKPGTSASAKQKTRAASTHRRGVVKQDLKPSYVVKQTGRHKGVLKNPTGRDYKKAVSLYRDFTGEHPRYIDDWDVTVPGVAMEVGKVTGIMYKARVDGTVQEFLHEFTGRSRPILAASADGRQLLLLGGDYKMTERGIVDGTYEFVR